MILYIEWILMVVSMLRNFKKSFHTKNCQNIIFL